MGIIKRKIAVDLGTANTVIMEENKVVVEQPSIVAIDRRTEEVIAVGDKALLMHEKTHENIKTIRPLRDGVIADFTAAQEMIRRFIRMIPPSNIVQKIMGSSWQMVISIPSNITEVEKRAVRESAEQAGAREVYLIYQPMAAAIGMNIDVTLPEGHMIIDIGGGTTDIAIISNQGIVVDQSIRVAGDEFTQAIIDYMKNKHNLIIGERIAEEIKKKVGAAIEQLEDPPEPMEVVGRDSIKGIPKKVTLHYHEVAEALKNSLRILEEAIIKALSQAPPAISADLHRHGIHITGGGSLLRGLDKKIHRLTGLEVHRAENPLYAVVYGANEVLKDLNKYEFMFV